MSKETPEPTSGELEVKLPLTWGEKKENIVYTITIEELSEDKIHIKRLELSRTEYHDGNHVKQRITINIEKGEYKIIVGGYRLNWYGTGPLPQYVITFAPDLQYWEDLWFEHIDELEDTISEFGVKETIEDILETIASSISDVLILEE